MAGSWLGKVGVAAAILGGAAILVASLRAIHQSTSNALRLSTRDGVLQPPLAGERPRAMALADDELVYVTNLENPPVTVRAAKRKDLGSLRVVRSRTVATLDPTVRNGWDVPAVLRVSPGRVLVRVGERRNYDGRPCCTSEVHVVERGSNAAWRTAPFDGLVSNEQVLATAGGFVLVAEKLASVEVRVLADGWSRFEHHIPLEAALRALPVRSDAAGTEAVVSGAAAAGGDVVIVARAPSPVHNERGDFDAHRVIAAPWAGGPVRELGTELASAVVVLGATKTGVWLHLTGSNDGASEVFVPVDGTAPVRFPGAQQPGPPADATAIAVAGEDLVLARNVDGADVELATWSLRSAPRRVARLPYPVAREHVLAIDAKDAVFVRDELALSRVTF